MANKPLQTTNYNLGEDKLKVLGMQVTEVRQIFAEQSNRLEYREVKFSQRRSSIASAYSKKLYRNH